MGWTRKNLGVDLNPINIIEKGLNVIGSVLSGAVEIAGKALTVIGNTVKSIIKDPLPTLLQIGGSMIGIPPYVTSAVITAARGGSLEDIAKSAAVSYISSKALSSTNIGQKISDVTKTAGQDFTDTMMKNFDLPPDVAVAISKAATASLNSSIVGGVNAVINGTSVADGISSGFTSGLIYSSTNSYFDSLNKDPNWGFGDKALNLMKGATSSALNSIVSGKGDPAQALGNYIAYSTINMVGTKVADEAKEAYTKFTTDTGAAEAAQDKYLLEKADYDKKVSDGEALRKDINTSAANYESKITNEYNPFKTSYDSLVAQNKQALTDFEAAVTDYEKHNTAYKNYAATVGALGFSISENGTYSERYVNPHYVGRGREYEGDLVYDIEYGPTKESFLIAANAAAGKANAASARANDISTSANNLYNSNKAMLDSLDTDKIAIQNKIAKLDEIKADVQAPNAAGTNTAAKLKAASDEYQTKYESWSKTKDAADRTSDNYTKALADTATRNVAIDALNTGAIKVTGKDADGNWALSNGMTLTGQGKFVQDGRQLFANAAGIPQVAMDFKAADGSNVDFNENAGRVLSETDVGAICRRDYGFTPTSDEIERLAGAAYTGTGNTDIDALADQKAKLAYSSITGSDPTPSQLAEIKQTKNIVGSAISLAKTGDADPWGNLEGVMLKAASGEAVNLTDAQMTDMVRKGLVFEGGDYSTKQDAANAARLAGYTQFEYDNSVYTMQPGGPTEKAVFQAAIDMQPNRNEAFNTARKLFGADATFDYKGGKFTTETVEERNARVYNSNAAIQARLNLMPAIGGSINTRTGTPENVANTFIDQKNNKVVEDTRVWDAAGNVVSGSLSVADQSKVLQVAGSLVLDAGTQMTEAITGVGKFLGAIDKNSEFAKNVNKLSSFNEDQKPSEVKAEAAQFWNDLKNAQGLANSARVVLSSVVDKPLMTGFNVASEIIQSMTTLGAGAGVKYASALLKASPSIAAKLGIGVDAVLNIGESAGAAYNESYKKALSSVGERVRNGSMTSVEAEAYAEDTAGKIFLTAAGVTGAVMLLPGGNALAKQILGSGAENAVMKETFKQAIKKDAANVGYNLAANTTIKETGSEVGEAALIEGASQKILSPTADFNWKDIVTTSMLEGIYGGGHSAVIASADIAVSNFQDKMTLLGIDKTEVENLTNKINDLVKSGNVSDEAIAAIKTEASNLIEGVGLRIDPSLDLMNDQFLSGVISQEVAGELSASGLSAEQIVKNLPNAIAHVESGNKIDPTYIDPFLTDDAEARQIAQSLGYTNPSQEVLNSLTGPISEVDARAKLGDLLASNAGFPDIATSVRFKGDIAAYNTAKTAAETALAIAIKKEGTALDLRYDVNKDGKVTSADALSLAKGTPIRSDIDASGAKTTATLDAEAKALGFLNNAAYTQYGGDVNAYNTAQTDAANLTKAKTSGFPDYASYTQFKGDVAAYTKANEDAANIRKATIAGFPDYATFLQYNGNIGDYTAAKTAETNKQTATSAGFPDFAAYTQYAGNKVAYDAAITNAANTQTASNAGFPDFATYTQYGGDKAAYDKVQTDSANLQAAKSAGFPDFASYTQYAGNVNAYNKAQKDAENLVKAETAGFPDYASYTQFKGDVTAYNKANEDAANIRKAADAGFPDYANFLQYDGKIDDYTAAKTAEKNNRTALDAGFPDYTTYTQYGGDTAAYTAAKTEAANNQTATSAGFPDFATYTQYGGNKAAYDAAITNAANTQIATTAGFPDFATYTQYGGNKAAYSADLNAKTLGWENAAKQTEAQVAGYTDPSAYATHLKEVENTQIATTAGFPDYATYTQYNGDKAAYEASKVTAATTTAINNAIAGINFPVGITAADVATQVKAAMDANPGLSAADVTKSITDYMTANPGLTAADVSKVIADATKGLATTEDIDTAIANIQFPAGITKADVAIEIKAAMDANPGLSAADVTKSITDYMTANPGLTADDVSTAITSATSNFVTNESFETALTGLSDDAKAQFDTLTQGQKDIVLSQVKLGTDLNTAITDAAAQTATDIAGVKTDISNLSDDVKTKFDGLTQGQKDIVDAQVKMGTDINTAIDNAAKSTTEQIATVKTDLTKNITDVQTQFNTRVDELMKQGQDYQAATQIALGELGTGVTGLQTSVTDIQKEQAASAARTEAAAKAGRASTAQAGIAKNLAGALAMATPAAALMDPSIPGYKNIGLKTTGEAKFEGPLEQYLKMLEEGSYAAKPQTEVQPTQQGATVQDELSAQQKPTEGTDYFNYGQQTDIDLAEAPGTQMLYSKAGGLATPLFAGGGTTRHGKYAGGGLGVVEHSGKARLDFRTGNAVTGPGDGQSDDIPAMLADGEFVFPADVVAALGNGSTKAGSDKLYDMMHSIRAYHRSAKPKDLPPPAKKSPLDYLKKTALKARR